MEKMVEAAGSVNRRSCRLQYFSTNQADFSGFWEDTR
jgi:hypothetical protein